MNTPLSIVQKAMAMHNPDQRPVLVITRYVKPVEENDSATTPNPLPLKPSLTLVNIVRGGNQPLIVATIRLDTLILQQGGHFSGLTTRDAALGQCDFIVGQARTYRQPGQAPRTLPLLPTAVAAEFAQHVLMLTAASATFRDTTMNGSKTAFLADLLGPDASADHTYLIRLEEEVDLDTHVTALAHKPAAKTKAA